MSMGKGKASTVHYTAATGRARLKSHPELSGTNKFYWRSLKQATHFAHLQIKSLEHVNL